MQEEPLEEIFLGDLLCDNDHARRRLKSRKQVKNTQNMSFHFSERKKDVWNKWENKPWEKTPNQTNQSTNQATNQATKQPTKQNVTRKLQKNT